MILGVGIDITEVARVQAVYEKFGMRFLKHILHPNEIAYCLSHKMSAPILAGRFSAKEAVSKAFGTGFGSALGWCDVEICRRESGQLYVVLHGKGLELLKSRGAKAIHISITHIQTHAAAVAVLEW